MISPNQQPNLNQINLNLLQPLTDEQSGTLAGGVSKAVIFALNQPSENSAIFDEPSGSIVDCLIFDLGGDAVVAEAPTFFTRLPFVSAMPRPQ
ncbi:MAG: hypothetical protein ACHWZW_10085 [Spirulina sp.]